MTSTEHTARAAPTVRLSDRFTDDRAPGTVVGSVGPSGARRLGVDAEGIIGIDNGALRLRPLAEPGWGREGLAYGPFEPVPGLALSAHVLNGHNASQTFYFPESRRQRWRRVLGDLLHRRPPRQHHYENLAVGFLPAPDATDPLRGAHTLVMHAATEDNGELWAATAGVPARIVRGVQNLPILFVVAVRDDGTVAYYASSLAGATGAAPYPTLRPLGIDHAPVREPVVAGIQQRILGEVGYRVDSRVYGVEVAVVDEWASPLGTAHAGDRFAGDLAGAPPGPLDGRQSLAGGPWIAEPGLEVTASGLRASGGGAGSPAATVEVGEPSGLVHATIATGRGAGRAHLRWRVAGAPLELVLDGQGCSLRAGERTLISDATRRLGPGRTHTVQVLDDGATVAVHLDGHLVGDRWVHLGEVADVDGGGIGLALHGDITLLAIEAHPRAVPLPPALDCGPPWTPPASTPALDERFDLDGAELDGATTPSGGRRWHRVEGEGSIDLRGDHARVRGDLERPNPGRTIFTVPWDDPGCADLELEMTIPGTERGQGHNGRCGVVFREDADNYLVVNFFVDDVFDGASISTFYHLGGHEEMYDAVWTLVPGVVWGERCTLRAAFDGERFLAWTNGEPCLVRALRDVYPDTPPLAIREVGIIVNWEWGDDTGTVLHRFAAGRGAGA